MDNFKDYYLRLLSEAHCIMVNIPKYESLMEYITKIPQECIYEEVGKHYGKEAEPHITVLYGVEPIAEKKAKHILSQIPNKLIAELGEVSKFKSDAKYDVLKIEVTSPHLTKIHEMLKRTCKNHYEYPQYNPHVTLAYVKKGTCDELVGDTRFTGTRIMFETFLYSNGNRQENHNIPMKEYDESILSSSNELETDLDQLSDKYKSYLVAHVSVDNSKSPLAITLNTLHARKNAPHGTGTKYMTELCNIADKYNAIIVLHTATRGDLKYPPEFKSTSSENRLKKFYTRFGFVSNYGKRTYRSDLWGNMHRLPISSTQTKKYNMKEYNVGTSGGYGGGAMAGGAVAPMNWAGTPSSPQTSRRLKNYPASRRYTYMQGNTVIGSALYDTITKDDLTDPRFGPEEIFAGLRSEMRQMEYPDKDVAHPIVIKNLESNPRYYSDLDKYLKSDKLEETTMNQLDPKELAAGTAIESSNDGGDDRLAMKLAMENLQKDPQHYLKLREAGLEDEGALTPQEAGYTAEEEVVEEPAVVVVKTATIQAVGQNPLSSSGLGKAGVPKPLKSDKLTAPETKIVNNKNTIANTKTAPLNPNMDSDPINHFCGQIGDELCADNQV